MSDLLILCYHAVDEDWPATLSVRPAALERQLTHLVQHGFRGATFTNALRGPRSRRTLVVTFDDGYRSVLEQAKPILDRLGLPGTLFVPTDWPGRTEPMAWDGIDQWLGTPHEPELRALDWDQLRGLAADGWEIGGHTCSHPHLSQVRDDDRLADELERSKAILERELDAPCTSLAYPYGDVDARVAAATERAGYAAACTIPRISKPLATDRLCWPRTPIHRVDTDRRFRVKVSPVTRGVRSSRAFAALAARGAS